MRIKVAILDDHPLVIGGLIGMLQLYPQIEVLATYSQANALLEGLKTEQPDVLLLDIQLPEMSGNEVAEIVLRQYPNIRIVVLTSVDNIYQVKDMMRRGCKGYLLKSADPKVVLEAIEQVYAGKQYFDAPIKDLLLQDSLKIQGEGAAKPGLTRREKEILQLIVAEHTNQEIADKLFLSLRTVEHHRYSIMHKLGVKNTVGAIKAALQLGLVQ